MIDLTALDAVDLSIAQPVGVGVSVRGRHACRRAGLTGAGRFRIASLTKPFTAVTTVRTAQAANVPLDTPAIELLPSLASHWRADRAITVQQLLAQTSGLASTVTGTDVAALGNGPAAVLDAARLTVGQENARTPGLRWEYYNGNYFLAGAIIEALTGAPFEEAVRAYVLGPWRLDGTGFVADESLVPGTIAGVQQADGGYPRGRRPSGGLISTVEDVLSFADVLLADPELMAVVGATHTDPSDPMRYGLGWAIGPSGQMFLNGRLPGYRTALLVLPHDASAAVVLAGRDEALPVAARWLDQVQRAATGDDLAGPIDAFAA